MTNVALSLLIVVEYRQYRSIFLSIFKALNSFLIS